jgi:cytochrome c oxidase subunit I+III
VLFELVKKRLGTKAILMPALLFAIALMLCAFGADLYGLWETGLRANQHAYGAAVYVVVAWQGFHVAVLLVMALYTLARSWSGLLDDTRRVTFDNTRLFWHYMVAQGLLGLALVHAGPRWLQYIC